MSFLDDLPKPFLALAPMDDVTDTVFRQIVATLPQSISVKGQSFHTGPDLMFTEFVNVDGLQSAGRPRLLHKLKLSAQEGPVIAQLWGLKPENFYKTTKELLDGTLIAEANALQGKDEKRSKLYETYSERASESLTPQSVASTNGVTGFASRQASAIRGKRMGFDGVDLNMGCPVKTVIKNGACAALINNRELAGEIIDATREAAHSTHSTNAQGRPEGTRRATGSGQAGSDFPVCVKTRVGFSTTDMSWLEFLLLKKLDLLSIHGRTAKQLSKTPADWELIGQIRQMRDSLCPTTLVIGNGDVTSRAQGLDLAKKYKLDGVMIGRGVFHDPFVFANPPAGGSPWEDWSKEQKIKLFRKHIKLFAETWRNGEYKFDSLKKFAKVYINGFDGAGELRTKFMIAENPQAALDLLSKEAQG